MTDADPFAGFEPTPLSMLTDVAFVVVHVSVELSPMAIRAGAAENVIPGPLLTVTVAWAVNVPPGPVAVNVYVVVCAG